MKRAANVGGGLDRGRQSHASGFLVARAGHATLLQIAANPIDQVYYRL